LTLWGAGRSMVPQEPRIHIEGKANPIKAPSSLLPEDRGRLRRSGEGGRQGEKEGKRVDEPGGGERSRDPRAGGRRAWPSAWPPPPPHPPLAAAAAPWLTASGLWLWLRRQCAGRVGRGRKRTMRARFRSSWLCYLLW
jgi:hypothetical protein